MWPRATWWPGWSISGNSDAAPWERAAEIERTNLQAVSLSGQSAWGSAAKSADQIVEWFGFLAEAGVQHVIFSSADGHDPAAIELLGRDVLPQRRNVEAVDPRRI